MCKDVLQYIWVGHVRAVMCLVTQSCPNVCDQWTLALQAPLSMGILQARILQWVAMASSRSSKPRNWARVSCIAGGFFIHWTNREAQRTCTNSPKEVGTTPRVVKVPQPVVLRQDGTTNSSVQFSSVTQSCLTLCNPMACSTPGIPVHHQMLELAQTHVHWVGDAI